MCLCVFCSLLAFHAFNFRSKFTFPFTVKHFNFNYRIKFNRPDLSLKLDIHFFSLSLSLSVVHRSTLNTPPQNHCEELLQCTMGTVTYRNITMSCVGWCESVFIWHICIPLSSSVSLTHRHPYLVGLCCVWERKM